MSSVCISSCLEDTRIPVRVRATYVNLYKWPESDAEFVRSVSFRGPGHPRPKVVESISCRQLYLRSYTFTRKESVNEKTKKCIGRVKERVVNGRNNKGGERVRNKVKEDGSDQITFSWGDPYSLQGTSVGLDQITQVGKSKKVPCAALKALFRKLLFCSASVDVVDAGW